MVKRGSDTSASSPEPSATVLPEKSNEPEQSNVSWWNIMNKIKPSSMRSPLTTPRNSIEETYTGRRHSFMTPEMEQKMAQRRASLEKLQVQKISPWMHLYDFTPADSVSESD